MNCVYMCTVATLNTNIICDIIIVIIIVIIIIIIIITGFSRTYR